MTMCPACHQEIAAGAAVCAGCGAAVAEAAGIPGQAPLQFTVGLRTHVGKVREEDEDAVAAITVSGFEKGQPFHGHVFVVSDGMGGAASGEVASALAMRAVAATLQQTLIPHAGGEGLQDRGMLSSAGGREAVMRRALETAQEAIQSYVAQEPASQGMGCTLTAVLVVGGQACIGHVGDTRAYLVRETVEQVTEDHSVVGRLVRMGRMTPEDALESPQRSMIYRALGSSGPLEADVAHRELRAGDYLVLCCDGVWEYIGNEELLAVIRQWEDPQRICDVLIERCLDQGADDNCTVLVARAWAPRLPREGKRT